jgi:hypothetical protein
MPEPALKKERRRSMESAKKRKEARTTTPRVPATSTKVTLISTFWTYRSFRVLSMKCFSERIVFLKLEEVSCVFCGLTNCTVGPKPTKGLKSEGLRKRPTK